MILFLLRGAPGSGKYSLARAMIQAGLADNMTEADDYYTTPEGYKWAPEKIGAAHAACREWVEFWMAHKERIIVSNTSTTKKHLKPYYDLAKKHGYMVQEIICRYPIFDNVHGVPEMKVREYAQQLENSLRGVEKQIVEADG